MDPICHTLVGGCLAQAGLKRRTGLGLATLVIAANLPDVDVLAMFLGRNLELRRGWTHGVLAVAVLPFLLAGAMAAWGRLTSRVTRFWDLALLSIIGVATHPALDFLNTYGMRWLMPFRDRWYYGDTLFIVDPWLWLLLGSAIVLVRRRERNGGPRPGGPARIALAAGCVYVGLMMAGTLYVRDQVDRALAAPARLMVAPVPVDPLERQVIADFGSTYRIGRVRIAGRSGLEVGPPIAKGDQARLAPLVARTREGAAFLRWARFPVYRARHEPDSTRIRVFDLRYSDGSSASWASLEVAVSRTDGALPAAP